MEFVKKLITLCVLVFAFSTVFGGFANQHEATFTIVQTSVHDCDEDVEVIVHKNPKDCCDEQKFREFGEPQKVQPQTILKPVDVVKVKTVEEIETTIVGANVKFGEIYCDKCKDEVVFRDYGEPSNVEKESMIMKIKNFVYDCFN